jgi:hypothetical protein
MHQDRERQAEVIMDVDDPVIHGPRGDPFYRSTGGLAKDEMICQGPQVADIEFSLGSLHRRVQHIGWAIKALDRLFQEYVYPSRKSPLQFPKGARGELRTEANGARVEHPPLEIFE